MLNTTSYNLIPVTRNMPTRTHADITYGVSRKTGDLSLVLSPSFIDARPKFAIGAKVIVGYNSETKALLIAPPADESATTGLRTIRPRAGFAGAGTILISAQNLPEGIPAVADGKRVAVAWEDEANDAVVLQLSELAV